MRLTRFSIQLDPILYLGSQSILPGNRWVGEGAVDQESNGQERSPQASLILVRLSDLLSNFLGFQVCWLFDVPCNE